MHGRRWWPIPFLGAMVLFLGCGPAIRDQVDDIVVASRIALSLATISELAPDGKYWIPPDEHRQKDLYNASSRCLTTLTFYATRNKPVFQKVVDEFLNSEKESHRYWAAEAVLFVGPPYTVKKEDLLRIAKTLSPDPSAGLIKSVKINWQEERHNGVIE